MQEENSRQPTNNKQIFCYLLLTAYHSFDRRGFTIVSAIIILILMGIVAGVATHFMQRLVSVRRELATEEELNRLKEAIIGNPRQLSKQGRNNFGYLGDTGGLPAALEDLYTQDTQPAYALDATARLGAGWAGPYTSPILAEDFALLLKDAFGNAYDYTTSEYIRDDGEVVSARIRSYGSNKADDDGTEDDKQIEILRKEIRSTVSGNIKDLAGAAISGATVRLYYPSAGSVNYVDTTTAGGLFQFTNVPWGVRSITATAPPTGNLKYAEDSALAYTAPRNNNLSFNITNWGASAITINSIRLNYVTSPQSFYEQVYVGSNLVFKYDDPSVPNYNEGKRRKSGDTLTFSNIIIPGGSTVSLITRILVASDNTRLPDIILSPNGGSTLNIRYLTFQKNESGAGGKDVSVEYTNFTVTLSNGSQFIFTAETKE